MAMRFRAENIGSLLRPQELLDARAAYRERRMELKQLREIEDRSILKALALQKAAGVQKVKRGHSAFSISVNNLMAFAMPPPFH